MRAETDYSHDNESSLMSNERDLNLVRSISSGSVPAWHEFIDTYSGLIYSVVRRHLFSEDGDDIRTVYVDVLASLYHGEITKYRGEASLSTWLIVFARSRSFDFFRKRYGRFRKPKNYRRLSEFEKCVLRYYIVDRQPLEIVIEMLHWRGYTADVLSIVKAVERIHKTLDCRYLNRLDREHQARDRGLRSQRIMMLLVQQRLDYEERSRLNRPDHELVERETARIMEHLREQISKLSPKEREVLFLRFDRGLSAKDISKELHLGGQRQVYTILEKIIRKLRRNMAHAVE